MMHDGGVPWAQLGHFHPFVLGESCRYDDVLIVDISGRGYRERVGHLED